MSSPSSGQWVREVAGPGHEGKVVVVDDDPLELDVMRIVLEEAGFDVAALSSEAVAAALRAAVGEVAEA